MSRARRVAASGTAHVRATATRARRARRRGHPGPEREAFVVTFEPTGGLTRRRLPAWPAARSDHPSKSPACSRPRPTLRGASRRAANASAADARRPTCLPGRAVPILAELWSYMNPYMLYGRHLGFKGNFEKLLADRDPKALELFNDVEKV